MKIINEALLNETTGRAKQSPRLRMNYNFHERLDDPVNRLLNALEPGTYLRPHRHLNPKKDEIFLLLRGRIAVFLFDNKGEITQTQILDPKEGVYGAEIKAGTWHGLLPALSYMKSRKGRSLRSLLKISLPGVRLQKTRKGWQNIWSY